jgi:hypothetical protein
MAVGAGCPRILEQFTVQAAADNVLRGGAFERGIVTGPFRPTNEVDYWDPAGLH